MNYFDHDQANNRGGATIIAAIIIAIVLVVIIATVVVLRRGVTSPTVGGSTTAQSPLNQASLKSLNNELDGVNLDTSFDLLLDEQNKDAARLQ